MGLLDAGVVRGLDSVRVAEEVGKEPQVPPLVRIPAVHGVAPKDERVARGDRHQLDPLVDEANLDHTVALRLPGPVHGGDDGEELAHWSVVRLSPVIQVVLLDAAAGGALHGPKLAS